MSHPEVSPYDIIPGLAPSLPRSDPPSLCLNLSTSLNIYHPSPLHYYPPHKSDTSITVHRTTLLKGTTHRLSHSKRGKDYWALQVSLLPYLSFATIPLNIHSNQHLPSTTKFRSQSSFRILLWHSTRAGLSFGPAYACLLCSSTTFLCEYAYSPGFTPCQHYIYSIAVLRDN